jgi:hypothetical protein
MILRHVDLAIAATRQRPVCSCFKLKLARPSNKDLSQNDSKQAFATEWAMHFQKQAMPGM